MSPRSQIKKEREAFHAEQERKLQLRLVTFREALKRAEWSEDKIERHARRYEVWLRRSDTDVTILSGG
jgi:hypothetical protein